ncbi:MAG: adenylate/guanylate cyclase domain-containing protein, partial [Candidatus Eremiobacteraeota bacterium]|nr:adenylate/guanylate cyclase domain-containing protein [Candidatus Eremiobacteraeota bacterium]
MKRLARRAVAGRTCRTYRRRSGDDESCAKSTSFHSRFSPPPARAAAACRGIWRLEPRVSDPSARAPGAHKTIPSIRNMAATLPTGTVTFAFSDIAGSTQRWERRREEMQQALRRHDALLREAIESNGGSVFKTVGDAFCAVFATAPEAVSAALAAQRAIAAGDWSAVEGLQIRMALHTGNAEERDGDYFGPAVNRVARLMGVANEGQIIISRVVADLVQGQMPSGTSLLDLGTHRLRDLTTPEQIFQIVAPDLRQDFPPLKSLEGHPTNLPVQLTPFIGRESEIAQITDLARESRLVTLLGSGGVGKTRTALQAAAELLDGHIDGAWFVELAPLGNPTLVPSAIAAVFNIEDRGGSKPLIETVAAALKSKNALLVIDNCEHLVSAAAAAAEHLLQQCPELRVIATSREPLGITGEATYRMPSLNEEEAVALFVTRAQAAQRNFSLNEQTEPIVRDIVRRL